MIQRAIDWLRQGAHAAAYADAVVLLARQPENGAVVDLLVRAAACAERQEEALEFLRRFSHRIGLIDYGRAQVSLLLLAGDLDAARNVVADLACVPEAGRVHAGLMIAIAEREGNFEVLLEQMRERERLVRNYPFAWLIARWEVQRQLGQHIEVMQEAAKLEKVLPEQYPHERCVVRLQRAMAVHNILQFEESTAIALDVIKHLLDSSAWPANPVSSARLWTWRRQGIVAAEIERLVLTEELPVSLHAGTLLALIREGNFFPTDQDMDLAALPPATSAMVVQALIATQAFRLQPLALDLGSFRSLVHIRTGLAVDVTEYQQEGDRFVSTWRHPSGVVLRRATVPAFSVQLVDHPGVARRLPLPQVPREQLRATYGNWEIPDPEFDTLVSAPNVMEFTAFLGSVASIRLADAMLSGRRGAAQHLAQRLRTEDIAPELMKRITDESPKSL
ncbi:MAG: hypothetical protein H6974_14735 [Gammaproteobacteria bacterium]|nr:hypothetical protein [Gammaproteobacteria bacterium]MCP5198017.1 hypothetical protein [Gammaproteobacteria bacterium]